MIFTSDNGADLNARERAGEVGVPNPLALPQAREAGNLSRAGEACQVPQLVLVSKWVGEPDYAG